MNLSIVSFQTAKDLKELGFDWPVFFFFNNKGQKCRNERQQVNVNLQNSSFYAAPTQAEVCKWLREKCKIHIWAEPSYHLKGKYYYMLSMNEIKKDEYVETGMTEHKAYEQAELAGIKKAIKILKERKK